MRAADSPFLVVGPVLSGFAAHVADQLHAHNPDLALDGAAAEDVQDLHQFRAALAEVGRAWTDTPAWPSIQGVLAIGYPAAVTNQLFARHLPGLLAHPQLPQDRHADLEATMAAVRRAANRWTGHRGCVDISAETPVVVPEPRWASDEWITSGEAAVLLKVTPRRVRQLAAAGLGVKTGSTWLLDRASLLARRDGRRPV